MKLNPVEFWVYFFLQLPFYYVLGLWVFPLGVISGVLGAMGGAENSSKLFRRLGVPFATCIAINSVNHGFLLVWVALIPAVVVVSLGYGQSSWLFCLFYRVNSNQKIADYLTRLSLYVLYWLSFGIALLFCKG